MQSIHARLGRLSLFFYGPSHAEIYKVGSENICFVGEGVCPKHNQCQQGPVRWAGRVPTPPWWPDEESPTAEGPVGVNPHVGPK